MFKGNRYWQDFTRSYTTKVLRLCGLSEFFMWGRHLYPIDYFSPNRMAIPRLYLPCCIVQSVLQNLNPTVTFVIVSALHLDPIHVSPLHQQVFWAHRAVYLTKRFVTYAFLIRYIVLTVFHCHKISVRLSHAVSQVSDHACPLGISAWPPWNIAMAKYKHTGILHTTYV